MHSLSQEERNVRGYPGPVLSGEITDRTHYYGRAAAIDIVAALFFRKKASIRILRYELTKPVNYDKKSFGQYNPVKFSESERD